MHQRGGVPPDVQSDKGDEALRQQLSNDLQGEEGEGHGAEIDRGSHGEQEGEQGKGSRQQGLS